MKSTLTNPIFKKLQLGWRFTVITVFFLSVLLGTLLYTTKTIQNEKSAALLIDMAGRQRMLLQKHLTEVFLTSQGVKANYLSTRNLLQKTLISLIEGGAVVLNQKTGQTQMVPAVPTEEILVKLREQKTLLRDLITHVDNFLLLSHDQENFRQVFQVIRAKNTSIIKVADDAVKELNAHSEANISAMVKWESLITILVALLGIVITGQGIQASRKLEKEMTEREHVQNELQKSQLFLHSIVENIPNMISVKTNEDLRYVFLNKTAEELLDCPRQDLLDKTIYDLVPKEQADFFTAKDREVLASKKLMDTPEEPIHLKSKGLRYIHTKQIPLLDNHGYPQYLLGIAEDITDRLQAQESLKSSEERYRALYDDNPSMYFTVSQDGTILSVNQFGAQQLGYLVEELVGLLAVDLFLEDDRLEFQKRFDSCLHNPFTLLSWEFRKVRKNGSKLWVKEVARAVHNKEREIVVLIVCEDISERKNTEQSLKEWKALTESILGQLPKGFAYRCLNDKNWPVIYMSGGFEEVTGFTVSTLLSGEVSYDTLMAPGENERVWPLVQDALAQHLPYENEHQIITSDGTTKWILARGRFIFDDQGTLLHLDGLNVDITEYKHIEQELRASEERFRSLVEHVPFCIHEIELDGKISSMNQAGLDMIEVKHESQAIGRSYLDLTEVPDHDRMRGYFAQAQLGQLVDFEFKVSAHDTEKIYSKSFIPVQGSDGQIIKIVGISEDITERTLAEERLRNSETKRIEALKQSDALKSALLSSVSHELRTPLTTMKTSVSNIMGNGHTGMNEVQHEFLNAVDKEINYMSRLVDNLLEMSQIEAGTLTPHREWHPLEDLLEGALRRIEVTFETRDIEISIPDELPPAFVDAVEIQQILINLLDNAIKYSWPDSPIRVNIRMKVQEFEVEVSNTGDPIDTPDLERIFERFFRQQSTQKPPVRGTGLGLAICKGIVEAHGGRIWAESTGQKITFLFTIPVTESMAIFSLEGLHKS